LYNTVKHPKSDAKYKVI